MNGAIYQKECLQNKFLRLWMKHKSKALFWPDLAWCHYSKDVPKWYEDIQVQYVKKDMSPPNCPELRPIERFWATMKARLKKRAIPAKTISDFRRK